MNLELKRRIFDATAWAVGVVVAAFLVTDAMAANRQMLSTASTAWQTECGSCHAAYPPRLLTAQSWRTIVKGLDRHFGVDASVDAPTGCGHQRLPRSPCRPRGKQTDRSVGAAHHGRPVVPARACERSRQPSGPARTCADRPIAARAIATPTAAISASMACDCRDNEEDTLEKTRILVWDLPVRVFHWLLAALVRRRVPDGRIGARSGRPCRPRVYVLRPARLSARLGRGREPLCALRVVRLRTEGRAGLPRVAPDAATQCIMSATIRPGAG